MTTLIDMRRLRLQLVEDERALRLLKEQFEATTADLSKRAFDTGTVNGRNAEERERNLICYLVANEDYSAARSLYRDAEWQRDRTTALLEAAKDERRAQEWQIRAKLADSLFRAGIQSDADDPAGNMAFDDSSLIALTNRLASLALQKDFQYRDVAREMIDAYNNGMADRINGAGEYEEDDPGIQNWLDAGRKIMKIDDDAYAHARARSEDGASVDWF